MNFKDWEKVKEDGKTCTLKHPKGHTMTISLKALPKIHQEQIKRLKFAKGGEARANYDDGTDPGGATPADASSQTTDPNNGTHITINAAPAQQAPATAPQPDVRSIGAQFKQGPPSSAPIQVPQPNDKISVREDDQAIGPIGLEQQAIGEQQAIDNEKAKQTAQNEAAIVGKRQDLAQQDASNINELKKHTDEYADYIRQNPINAKQFQDNMGTGSKITTGLGLFLGGLGTPFGGQNVALDMLNKQIDRNIDGQKANAEQQKNVWGAYEHLYGDQNIATNLAKISANDILVHQANLLAAQLGTPQAKANADMLSAQKGKENTTLFGVSGSRLTGINNGTIPPNPGPSGMARMKAMPPPPQAQTSPAPGQPQAQELTPEQLMKNRTMKLAGFAPPFAESKKADVAPPKEEATRTYPLVRDDADSFMKHLARVPKARDEIGKIEDEFKVKRRAEAVLNGPNNDGVGGVHDIMQQLYANTGKGSVGPGAIMHHIVNKGENALESIPFGIGPAAKNIVDLANLGPSSKAYQRNVATMKTDIATALKDLVSYDDVNKIVNANLPTLGDTPEQVEEKETAIVNMIKKGAKTPLLDKWNVSKKEK